MATMNATIRLTEKEFEELKRDLEELDQLLHESKPYVKAEQIAEFVECRNNLEKELQTMLNGDAHSSPADNGTGYLRSILSRLLEGFTSINLFPSLDNLKYADSSEDDDFLAIKSDWQAIGSDLFIAIERYRALLKERQYHEGKGRPCQEGGSKQVRIARS